MISYVWVFSPLVRSVELLDEAFGQQSLYVTNEDDVILAMEVDPAAVTVLGI